MKETDIAARVLADLRRTLPGFVVVKHNDQGTKGVPDIQAAGLDHTSWGELKELGRNDTLRKINHVEQLLVCHQFAIVNNGRCWVLVYETLGKGSGVQIWQPRALFAHLWPTLAGPPSENAKWKTIGRELLRLDTLDSDACLTRIMDTAGAVWVPGRDYGLLGRLIRETHPALRGRASTRPAPR